MLKHYIKTALRNIIKNKIISIISIVGYTIGLTCALLILLYVLNETSYDRHHKNKNRIYRVIVDDMGAWEQSATQYILAPTMKMDFPEISAITRINWLMAGIKKSEDEYINQRFWSADNDIFEIFTIPFIHGNPESALIEPFSVVITESMAHEYFENEDPLNKTLTIKIFEDEFHLTVTGIIKEFPKTGHLQARIHCADRPGCQVLEEAME
ncbi:MAG: ABC transporter permease [Bacteroidales bacterium]|nr:ABC transporter permease [Bacteroidales bacterium]